MKQLTIEQITEFHNSGVWKTWTNEQICRLQLYQEKLCFPLDVVYKAYASEFGRPVFTHELGSEALIAEYEGRKPTPTLEEIISLIPKEKRIILEL